MFDFDRTCEIVESKRTENLLIDSLLDIIFDTIVALATNFDDFVEIQIIVIFQGLEVFSEVFEVLVSRNSADYLIIFVINRIIIVDVQKHDIDFECHLNQFLLLLGRISRIPIYQSVGFQLGV